MRWFLILALLFKVSSAWAIDWHGHILEADTGSEFALSELAERLGSARIIVLGEKHYTSAVQAAQAAIIEAAVKERRAETRFTTGWEFLNHKDNEKIATAFARFSTGEIPAREFLALTQGNDRAQTYIPILETTARLGGSLIGLNLSREDKAPVVNGGLAAANPALIPPGFALGGTGYFERFAATMAGHATPEKIQNYFAAQCLTDDVMAYHLLGDSAAELKFLVTGSFHAEYGDGAVARLERAPGERVMTVQVIDASDYAEAELRGLLRDPHYGLIADYVYFVNEPASR